MGTRRAEPWFQRGVAVASIDVLADGASARCRQWGYPWPPHQESGVRSVPPPEMPTQPRSCSSALSGCSFSRPSGIPVSAVRVPGFLSLLGRDVRERTPLCP